MKKIIITGPESSGKTTLAKALAAHFKTVSVPEFAREYIDQLGRPYVESDLLEIAKGQLRLENEMAKRASNFLFCDTDLITIKIWALDKFGKCDPWILEQITQRQYELYLLCASDIPWEPDPQREDENRRDEIFEMYAHELKSQNVNWEIVRGLGEKRLRKAIELVEQNFQKDD